MNLALILLKTEPAHPLFDAVHKNRFTHNHLQSRLIAAGFRIVFLDNFRANLTYRLQHRCSIPLQKIVTFKNVINGVRGSTASLTE